MNIRYIMAIAISTVVFVHAKVQHINTTVEFDAALKNNNFVIAKFGAEWCGPCRVAKPKYEKVSEQFKDILFVDVDVDKGEAIANRYDISGIPAFIYFKNGREVKRHSGGGEGIDITIKNNITSLFGSDRSAIAQKPEAAAKEIPVKENVVSAAVKGTGGAVEKVGEATGEAAKGIVESIGDFFRSIFG